MLKIRFVRVGKKNKPFFRIAVGDSRRTPKGKFIEKLGYYNPLKKEKSVNKERVLHWLSNGAQCSDTVHNLLVSLEIIKGSKRKIKIKSKKKGKGEEKSEDKTQEVKEKVKTEGEKESVNNKVMADEKSVDTSTKIIEDKPVFAEAMADKEEKSKGIEKSTDASDKDVKENKEEKSEAKTEEAEKKEEIKEKL